MHTSFSLSSFLLSFAGKILQENLPCIQIGKLGSLRMIHIKLVENRIVKAHKNVQSEQTEENIH
jgi:hypothetical protein